MIAASATLGKSIAQKLMAIAGNVTLSKAEHALLLPAGMHISKNLLTRNSS
jgi:hypothetical protein